METIGLKTFGVFCIISDVMVNSKVRTMMSATTLEVSPDITPVLNELVSRLCSSELPLAKIVLFGSYARGTARDDSDIDLMVIVDNDDVLAHYDARMNRYLGLSRLIRSINEQYAIDLIVYSQKELGLARKFSRDFINEIEQTGRTLYERAS